MKKEVLRMCASCRKKMDKSKMHRIAKLASGKVELDENAKLGGRGIYICDEENCLNNFTKKRLLNKSFKTNIENNVYEKINNQLKNEVKSEK